MTDDVPGYDPENEPLVPEDFDLDSARYGTYSTTEADDRVRCGECGSTAVSKRRPGNVRGGDPDAEWYCRGCAAGIDEVVRGPPENPDNHGNGGDGK